jgi:hypothetical protein
MDFDLAQVNVGRLHQSLEHEDTAEFVAALDAINALAEGAPGFIWRLEGEDGESSSYVEVEAIDDPLFIVNYSIWDDLDSLREYVYKTDHSSYLRRRRDWFEKPDQATTACWWVPAGTIPDVNEAYAKLEHLRAHGPSSEAWTFNRPFPPPETRVPKPL